MHHFHSGIEFAAFLLFTYSGKVTDLREQYPLPLIDTITICKQLGIRHPQNNSELCIVTTDILVDLNNGNKLAIAVKPTSKLKNKRTLEKLQIERSYWESQGADWYIFTEKEISSALKQNLQWLKPFLDPESSKDFDLTNEDTNALIIRLSKYQGGKVSKICGLLDDKYQVDAGTHITALRFAIANNVIKMPLNTVFHELELSDIDFVDSNLDKAEISNAS